MLVSFMILQLSAGCTQPTTSRGVYRSGQNAVAAGARVGDVRVWGPDGTYTRSASEAPGANTWLGGAGPLWVVDHDVPAPPRAPIVAAATVESAGFRMRDVLGTTPSQGIDAARPGGVYVRSAIKVRGDKSATAPPMYVVTATGDSVGAGRFGGPADVRSGDNCKAAIATMDAKAEHLLSSHTLTSATRLCVIPTLLSPVDIDGDGVLDVLAYGQDGERGFRSWFTLHPDGTLVPGPEDVWEHIP